jgi:hypothetical protein
MITAVDLRRQRPGGDGCETAYDGVTARGLGGGNEIEKMMAADERR